MDIIDKSSLISELVADNARIVLLPRPRRFGKTTNLTMLRYFFESSPDDRTDLFSDLHVWQDSRARDHFQRHPVIWLSFKDIKYNDWENTWAQLKILLRELVEAHAYLLKSEVLSAQEREDFEALLRERAPRAVYDGLLKHLIRWLAQFHGETVVLLLDEYDTPIYSMFGHDGFETLMTFMRAFLGGGLKDNKYLYKGVVTGILRVARESLFSGLNNLAVYSLLSPKYATAFGFTEEEVADICNRLGKPELLNGMRELYNGYTAQPASRSPIPLYNPWSVICCADDPDHALKPHWLNTASDELLREMMIRQGHALTPDFEKLLAGEEVERPLEEHVVLRELNSRDDALWSFLFYAGYLKVTKLWWGQRRKAMATYAVPNLEVMEVFSDVFLSWLTRAQPSSTLQPQLTKALLGGDASTLEKILSRLMVTNFSYHDPVGRQPEKLYQGFVMGLLVYLEGKYEVRSNPESGYGRVDVLIKPREAGQPGVVMELKVLQEDETVATALENALEQLKSQAYCTQLEAAGATPIHTYAALFDGKRMWLVTPDTWSVRFAEKVS